VSEMSYFPTSTLSESSKVQFTAKLAIWLELLGHKDIKKLLRNPEEAIGALEKAPTIKHSPANHHLFISSVVAVLKHEKPKGTTIKERKELLERWLVLQKDNSKPLREHYLEEKPTELQASKAIHWGDVLAARDALPMGMERLLLGFYTHLNPVRADFFETEIVPANTMPTSKNYILMDSVAKLVLTDFKTKHTYEKIEQVLPAILRSELEESVRSHPRSYLFTRPESPKDPFDRRQFSGWACRVLTRVFGRPMTLTVLRHAFITDLQTKGLNLKERDTIAKSMGHTLSMQQGYAWNNVVSE